MTRAIPQGTYLGQIETSLDWLLTHTTRFFGAIVVRIYTGEGYILIGHGLPVVFVFHMGDRVIRGNAARGLFEQADFINASLHRYTDQEFREALAIAGPEALATGSGGGAVKRTPVTSTLSGEDRMRAPGPAPAQAPGPVTIDHDFPREEPAAGAGSLTGAATPIPGREHTPENVLDWICYSPGVTAAAIFRNGSIADYRGETSPEYLVEPAEGILLSAWEILALLSTGPLVQVTIRLFGRNVTIAPFDDGYLLVLTEPEVNLGLIRKLVHDVAQAGTG